MIAHVYRPKRRVDGRVKVARLYRGRLRLFGDERVADIPLGTTDKRIAEKRLKERVEAVERERAGLLSSQAVRVGGGKPLKEQVKDLVADLRTKGRNREYVKRIDQRLARVFDACQWRVMGDVDPGSFIAWRNRQTELSPKTLNEYLAALGRLFGWLRGIGRVDRNPFEGVERIDGRGKAKIERRALTPDELRRLQAVCGERWPAYLVAVKTGLRRGELLQLQWADLHLDGARPFLRLRAVTTKNRRESDQPIDGEAVEAFQALKREGVGPVERVFRRRLPRRETVQKDFAAAGIPKFDERGRKADFHALRTTYCTMLAEADLPERVRQELMRHRDPRLTNQTYTDPARLRLAEAVERLPRLGDTQIDSQGLVTARRELTPDGTYGPVGDDRKCLPVNSFGRGEAGCDTKCHHDSKTGGGGNRTPVPRRFHKGLYVLSRSFDSRDGGRRSTGSRPPQPRCLSSRPRRAESRNQPTGVAPQASGRRLRNGLPSS